VRNWGTIGGSCAHADPSSDWPAVLIACRASVVCRNTERERVVAARDFFVDTFQTAIEPDEILTEVRVPLPGAGGGSAYQKLERRAGDFATVGAAVALRLGSDGRVAEAGLGLTAVAEAPFAATAAEAQLTGATPDAATLERVAATAAGQARPVADRHGPVDYKTAMVREMTLRALRLALQRAGAAA
jgi:carbon-monoxide dehydrogenase medium subunit